MNKKYTNRLIHESSPYLQQHAQNPVYWYPWGEDALRIAREEDKPILLSIGYSSCHWCHVMERESFENDQIAEYLNKHFISIKVDREENPDVDQVYMDAVQAMGVQGGWPLNVFLTPEQKPFFGGTYFPPRSFMEVLQNVQGAFSSNREKLDLSAEELTNHLSRSEVSRLGLAEQDGGMDNTALRDSLLNLGRKFDREWGGFDRAPKFPMPSIWKFLLRYGHMFREEQLIEHTLLTLQQMEQGGIYDQVGGGFARYSVDGQWFAPHFEKMLYDNGQLISLYAEAYSLTGSGAFREVIMETIRFLKRELQHQNGGFYAALDADSEGVEGKFYTWHYEEFIDTIGKDPAFWADFFGATPEGNWEDGVNILTRRRGLSEISEKFNISDEKAAEKLRKIKEQLLSARSRRVRPGLDDKVLAGWNGIALSGLIHAYYVLGEKSILDMAVNNALYVVNEHIRDGRLYRTPFMYSKSIPGYLEDYAFVIQAFTGMYQITFDESWLMKAKSLMAYALDGFFDADEGFFFYTDKDSKQLIAAKKELFDNVIPASNSVMAENLYLLGLLLDESDWVDKAEAMVHRMTRLILTEPEYASNWGNVYLMMTTPTAEIAIVGKDAHTIRNQISTIYHPNRVFCGTTTSSDLPLLKGRDKVNDNTIYVCYDKTCKLPVHTVEEALKLLD